MSDRTPLPGPQDEFVGLLLRHFDGSLSESESRALLESLKRSPERRALALSMARLHGVLLETLSTEKQKKLQGNAEARSSGASRSAHRRRRAVRSGIADWAGGSRVAIGVAAALLLLVLGLLIDSLNSESVPPQETSPVTVRRALQVESPPEKRSRPDHSPQETEPPIKTPPAGEVIPHPPKPTPAEPPPVSAPKPETGIRVPEVIPDKTPAPASDSSPKPVKPTTPKPDPQPKAPSVSAVAVVERVQGGSRILGPEGALPATKDALVLPGSGIENPDPQSRLLLRLPDGTRLELAGESSVEKIEDTGGITIVLNSGRLTSQAVERPKDRPLIIQSPTAEATVLGTLFRVSATSKETRLEVAEGVVKMTRRRDGAQTVVRKGRFAVARRGLLLTTRPLPKAFSLRLWEPETWAFGNTPEGTPPASFQFAAAKNASPGRWEVRSVDGRPVLAQLDAGTSNRYVCAVIRGSSYRNVRLKTRVKTVSGYQRVGLVWRYKDANNYYYVGLGASQGNVRVDRVAQGERTMLSDQDVTVQSGAWHELVVEQREDRIRVRVDGKQVLDVLDSTYDYAGNVGFWLKDDTIAYFDALEVEEID